MNKIKLTKAQKEVMRRMKEGEEIHRINGASTYYYWGWSNKNVNWGTLVALENIGLVKRTDKRAYLTELGKSINL